MFDSYARQLIELLPELPNIDRSACRRALSEVYYHIVRQRLTSIEGSIDNDIEEARVLLRNMADALESVAIFDVLEGIEHQEDVVRASAFVAAESLALLADFENFNNVSSRRDPLLHESNYAVMESALLYMVGGYDINAKTVSQKISFPSEQQLEQSPRDGAKIQNAIFALYRIQDFCQGSVTRPRRGPVSARVAPIRDGSGLSTLLDYLSAAFYGQIGESLDSYLDWLGGFDSAGFDVAISKLEHIRAATLSSEYPGVSLFAEIYHLSSLLVAAIYHTGRRSLVNVTPPPDATTNEDLEAFHRYIRHRARGDGANDGRPYLWPSAQQYIEECLPGPHRSAVIAMPTGSGKSFVAELAIVHALAKGWVLYLAPTNALVHQIRRDLRQALAPLGQTVVKSFLGQHEYTTMSGERLAVDGPNFVAVMTPEKCSVALRLFPEQFENCVLCVFDECHLLSDAERGVTADTVVGHLASLAPSLKYLLMSAMVNNSDELAEWLSGIHQSEATALSVKWRPTRALRGLLVVEKESLEQGFAMANSLLEDLPPSRVNQPFSARLALVAGLSGPWTLAGSVDYRIARLPVLFEAHASRHSPNRPVLNSWKNTAAKNLAVKFARSGIPTICFILSSRHHVFSSSSAIEDSLTNDAELPPLVNSWLAIADAELGVPSAVRDLLIQGTAVHSSAMIAAEHLAAEFAFKSGTVNLMLATPTLAQGLNLPAVTVVVAGTSTGDPRASHNNLGSASSTRSRTNSLILNSFGRAGRPGFVNQGVAVLVSDEPYIGSVTRDSDPTGLLEEYPVLQEPDAAVHVQSPLQGFIDKLLVRETDIGEYTEQELVVTSLLAENEQLYQTGADILIRTLAAYQTSHRRDISQAQREILSLRLALYDRSSCPDWINVAAMRAGVDFERARLMWESYQKIGLVSLKDEGGKSVLEWLDVLEDVMAELPPKRVVPYLTDTSRTRTPLTRMREKIVHRLGTDSIPWNQPSNWSDLWAELTDLVRLFMTGVDYSTIAAAYLGLSENSINNRRSSGTHPIPKILSIIRNLVDQLSIDAGLFLAIHEQAVHKGEPKLFPLPQDLEALPLCIRNGFDSIGSLSWYRFGFRHRLSAHLLQSIVPVPDALSNDDERMHWVTERRAEWLDNPLTGDEPALLSHIRLVMIEGEGLVH